MTPQYFPQADMTTKHEGITIPYAYHGNEVVSLWQLSEDELKKINTTGMLWIRVKGAEATPCVRPTVYNPYIAGAPLVVDDIIADRVIIHKEEDRELIILQIDRGEMIEWAKCFREKVKLLGSGVDLPEFKHLCEQYKIDPWMAIFFQRINPY